MADLIIPTQAWAAMLIEAVDDALIDLADNFGIVDWPADAPRFHALEVGINYHPSSLLWELTGTVTIFGPERESEGFSRAGWQMVKEELFLSDIPQDIEDEDFFAPYTAAFATVLAARVRAVIKRRREKKNATSTTA